MASGVCFHQTLNIQGNILDIISGHFWDRGVCSIWNRHTIFQVSEGGNGRSAYTQPFMSKVYKIIKGPMVNNFDTFFAARESDILQFCFCPEYGIFRCINRYTLPKTTISPEYIQANETRIFASSVHGGWCIIDLQNGDIVACGKDTNIVSMVCEFSRDAVVRVEKHYQLYKYSLSEATRTPVRCSVGEGLIMIMPYDNGRIAVMSRRTIAILSEEGVVMKEDMPEERIALGCCRLWTRERTPCLLVLFFTKQQTKLLCRVDTKREEEKLVITEAPQTVQVDSWNSFRLVGITNSHALLMNKGTDHIIIDINNPGTITSCSRVAGTIGTRQFKFGTSTDDDSRRRTKLQPQAISLECKGIAVLRQGLRVNTSTPTALFKEAPTNMIRLMYNNRWLIFVSFLNSTKLYEMNEHTLQVRECEDLSYVTNDRTLAVIQTGDGKINQVFTRGGCSFPRNAPLPEPKNHRIDICVGGTYRRDDRDVNILILAAGDTTHRDRYSVRARFNERFVQLQTDFTITVLEMFIAPVSRKGYLGFGRERSGKHSFAVSILTDDTDRMERALDNDNLVVAMDLNDEVTAIKFVERKSDAEREPKISILLGLSKGNLVTGTIKQDFGLVDIVTYNLGTAPIRLFPGNDHNTFYGVSSRTYVVRATSNGFQVTPLIMSPCAFIVHVKDSIFLGITGTSIAVYRFDDKSYRETEISSSHNPPPGKEDPVAICSFGNLPYMLVAYRSMITRLDMHSPIPQQDVIYSISVDNQKQKMERVLLMAGTNGHITRNNNGYLGAIAVTVLATRREEKHQVMDATKLMLFVLYRVPQTEDTTKVQIQMQPHPPHKVYAMVTALAVYEVEGIHEIVCAVPDHHNGCTHVRVLRQQRDCIDQPLQIVAEIKLDHVSIKHLVARKLDDSGRHVQIIVGDQYKSVKILEYDRAARCISIKAEEGVVRPISVLDVFSDGSICGGDTLGNFFLFDQTNANWKAKMGSLWQASTRISPRMNFNVGDVVTGVTYTRGVFPCFLYQTISGGVGAIIQTTTMSEMSPHLQTKLEERMRLMRVLEMEMSSLLLALTKCDHIGFRNKYWPSTNIIDMDVIIIFSNLRPEKRAEVCEVVARRVKDANLTPDAIDREICRMNRYFMWN